jgi:hypothetical protein
MSVNMATKIGVDDTRFGGASQFQELCKTHSVIRCEDQGALAKLGYSPMALQIDLKKDNEAHIGIIDFMKFFQFAGLSMGHSPASGKDGMGYVAAEIRHTAEDQQSGSVKKREGGEKFAQNALKILRAVQANFPDVFPKTEIDLASVVQDQSTGGVSQAGAEVAVKASILQTQIFPDLIPSSAICKRSISDDDDILSLLWESIFLLIEGAIHLTLTPIIEVGLFFYGFIDEDQAAYLSFRLEKNCFDFVKALTHRIYQKV